MPFVNLDGVKEVEPVPGYRARFIHSESMTVAHWTIAADAPMPEHGHKHEQIVNLIEGEFELTVAGKAKIMRPGDVAVIPPDVPHAGRAITDCRILDVFHPVREDYR